MKRRLTRHQTVGLLLILASISWVAVSTYNPGLLFGHQSLWILQALTGAAISYVIFKKRNFAPPTAFILAAAGFRSLMTLNWISIISATLSASVMLLISKELTTKKRTERSLKGLTYLLIGVTAFLCLPFPFEEPLMLRIPKEYKIKAISRHTTKMEKGRQANIIPLTSALQDADPDVRKAGIGYIIRLMKGDSPVIHEHKDTFADKFINALDHPETRPIAIKALIDLGEMKDLPFLINAVKESPDMQNFPAGALFRSFGEKAAGSLISVLDSSGGDSFHEARVRRRVLGALSFSKNPRIVWIIGGYLSDENRDVRTAAKSALMRMHPAHVTEMLTSGIKNAEVHFRRTAVEILGNVKADEKGSEKLLEILLDSLKDEDEAVRKYAAEALGKMKRSAAVTGLIEAAVNDSLTVKKYAIEALGRIQDGRAAPALLDALESPELLIEAAGSLFRINMPESNRAAFRTLMKALENDDPFVRLAAADMMGKLGWREAVPALTAVLKDPRWEVRQAAVFALGNIADESTAEALARMLHDNEPTVRFAAVEAILRLDNPDAADQAASAMIKDLSNPEATVRASAAELLGKIGDEEVEAALLRMVKRDPNPKVKRIAASAMALLTGIRAKNWAVIGPFDNTDGKRFDQAYPPEKEINLTAVYDGKGGPMKWKSISNMDTRNLLPLFQPDREVLVYALTIVKSAVDRKVHIRLGSDDGIKVWFNDEPVWSKNLNRKLLLDQDIIPVEMKKGNNKLLLKITQYNGDWGFHCRITDQNGYAVPELEYMNPFRRYEEN